ncbi:hypothetical protein MLD38_009483 [Melastoma candidum]|uniref:Uncharacterized protein n=1 Tax=Melastoma candidum TaxID=119954 RepID=A0ACB9S1D7_9MYRT|nr:hypothetical protein MLD38_009483 [Melastoma candidum]
MEDMPGIVPYAAAKISGPTQDGAAVLKFRGVVPQQNGNWGAQIYANHQRIWLGTFRTEREAAMAYDSASIVLRRGDTQRNFPWTEHTLLEPTFQMNFPPGAVLDMIRDGTYQSKFSEFLRSEFDRDDVGENSTSQRMMLHSDGEFLCKLLFQKELTPSDVGKLNRLVIPKKCAVKYFPYVQEMWYGRDEAHSNNNNAGSASSLSPREVDDVQLVFYDKGMRLWKFRYCYWKSSQSFVFTRGWNRFVKDKNLKAKDCVLFYACQRDELAGKGGGSGVLAEVEEDKFCLIDVEYSGNHESNINEHDNGNNGMEVELRLNLGNEGGVGKDEEEDDDEEEEDEELGENGFRLFGVQINASP